MRGPSTWTIGEREFDGGHGRAVEFLCLLCKEAWPANEAPALILSQSGKEFDPGVVKALVAMTGLTPAAHCRE